MNTQSQLESDKENLIQKHKQETIVLTNMKDEENKQALEKQYKDMRVKIETVDAKRTRVENELKEVRQQKEEQEKTDHYTCK